MNQNHPNMMITDGRIRTYLPQYIDYNKEDSCQWFVMNSCFSQYVRDSAVSSTLRCCVIWSWLNERPRSKGIPSVTWPSHDHHMTITWPSHDSYMTITWQLHGHHMTITWLSHDHHMTVTWPSHDSYMTITWQLHDHHMTITWLSHDSHMTITWQSHDSYRMLYSCPCLLIE